MNGRKLINRRLFTSLGTVIGLLPSIAWADHLEQTVAVTCDLTAHQLVIEHHGAYNQEGDRLLQNLGPHQWDIGHLIGTPTGKEAVSQTCQLGQTQYHVNIVGVSWGGYGQEQTAHITVTAGQRTLFNRDLQGTTFTTGSRPVITKIVFTDAFSVPDISIANVVPY